MANDHRWESLAGMVYSGTKWEKSAMAAGIAMDNRLNTIAKDLFGQEAESGMFDVQAWLVWFDPEVLKRRGLENRATIHT